MFLTGSKAALGKLAVDDFKLTAIEKKPGERENAADLFIHSEKFVLVDQHGRIRGYYDGQTEESIPQLVNAVQSLSREH